MISMNTARFSISHNVFDYLGLRQENRNARLSVAARDRCIAQHLPEAVKENELSFGEFDKIFAAQWLDETHIIVGTKCNKLAVQNIVTKKTFEIPMLTGSPDVIQPDKNCGIHSISINSNNTALVTGGDNPNSIGIYKLPSLEPLAIGEYHNDWMFSSTWVTDEVVATGSRDKCLAFWQVPHIKDADDVSCYDVVKPIQTIEGNKSLDKVRAMVYNPFSEHLVTIASNGYVHLWDVNNCTQVICNALPFLKENVCIAHEKSNLLYAVGSLSHVSLLETRTARAVGSLCSNDQGAGVRSVSFNDCIVTIGTGYGSLLFYDIRMNKLLQRNDGTTLQRKSGKGWLRKDSVYQEFFWDTECYPNAIYSHAYHPTTMKLLTAGGPLALGLYGNYAAYWD